MSPENTQILWEKFPALYPENFCFDCGDGWFNLLYDLSRKLQEEILTQENPEYLQAFQVKEKYGALRFYTGCETDKMRDLIDEAENKSQYICETCSAPGILMLHHAWWTTSCVKCQLAKREADGTVN